MMEAQKQHQIQSNNVPSNLDIGLDDNFMDSMHMNLNQQPDDEIEMAQMQGMFAG